MGQDALIRRIDELLAKTDAYQNSTMAVEAFQGALAALGSIYGNDSPQVRNLLDLASKMRDRASFANALTLSTYAFGALQSLRAELEGGLIGNFRMRGAGESLGDILGLAKDALRENNAEAKNVAAVLAVAAYEDTLRRMGESLAGVTGRPKLAELIGALKKAGVLEGASISIASGSIKFRNDALHADWAKIDVGAVQSVIAFVEGLLLKHFS